MGLDVSLQVLQSLESLGASNLGASMVLTRATVLASTCSTATPTAIAVSVGATCGATRTASAASALVTSIATLVVSEIRYSRGYCEERR